MKSPLNRGLRHGIAGRKIGIWDWILLPALIAIAATLLLNTSVQPFGLYLPEPVFPFVLAFTWPLIRPSVIAPMVLALLGLYLDWLWFAPLGFWTLGLVSIYGIMLLVRTFVVSQDWTVILAVYLAALVVFNIILIIFSSLDSGTIPRLWGVFEQAFATALCFPIVLNLMDRFVSSEVRFQ